MAFIACWAFCFQLWDWDDERTYGVSEWTSKKPSEVWNRHELEIGKWCVCVRAITTHSSQLRVGVSKMPFPWNKNEVFFHSAMTLAIWRKMKLDEMKRNETKRSAWKYIFIRTKWVPCAVLFMVCVCGCSLRVQSLHRFPLHLHYIRLYLCACVCVCARRQQYFCFGYPSGLSLHTLLMLLFLFHFSLSFSFILFSSLAGCFSFIIMPDPTVLIGYAAVKNAQNQQPQQQQQQHQHRHHRQRRREKWNIRRM